jgi:sugar phosphate isomerase/epimerase
MARVGLMLYTVRDECAHDLEGTLRAVAAMGYEGVELFDLHGHEPARVRGWLDELGLAVAGRHAGLEAIETRLPELAREAEEIGWRRLVLSWLNPSTLDDPAWPERLGRAAAEAASLGLELGYHNHDAEVRDGFLDRLPPELYVELDLGWTWWAGADPVELLERLRGRVPLVHVKDFRSRGDRDFAPVGDGAVGYERVAPAAVAAGVEWLLVEQDETDGPALEAARRSLSALIPMLEAA